VTRGGAPLVNQQARRRDPADSSLLQSAWVSTPPHYSHVVEVNGPHRPLSRGQTGADRDGKIVRAPAHRRASDETQDALASVGRGSSTVVKLNSYLTTRTTARSSEGARLHFPNKQRVLCFGVNKTPFSGYRHPSGPGGRVHTGFHDMEPRLGAGCETIAKIRARFLDMQAIRRYAVNCECHGSRRKVIRSKANRVPLRARGTTSPKLGLAGQARSITVAMREGVS